MKYVDVIRGQEPPCEEVVRRQWWIDIEERDGGDKKLLRIYVRVAECDCCVFEIDLTKGKLRRHRVPDSIGLHSDLAFRIMLAE